MRLLVFLGASVASLGVIQWASIDPLAFGAWKIDWKPLSDKMHVYSALGNPNWVAGFLVGVLPLALAFAALSKKAASRGAASIAAVIMVCCIAATQSLGGLLAVAASGVCAASLYLHSRPPRHWRVANHLRRAFLWLAGLALLACLLAGLMWGQSIWATAARHIEGRAFLWKVTARMAADQSPLRTLTVGRGYETFALGYLPAQAKYLAQQENFPEMKWASNAEHAHNDHLETFIEMGAFGIMVWFLFLVLYFRLAGRACKEAPSDQTKLLLIACSSGAAAILAQAVVDFPFKVLPVALLFWTLIALTVCLSGAGRPILVKLPKLRPLPNLAASVCAIALVLAASAWFIRPIIAGHHESMGEHYEALSLLEDARASYERGLALDPHNAELRLARARLHLVQGDVLGALQDADVAERFITDPALYLLRSRALASLGRPQEAETYRNLANATSPKNLRRLYSLLSQSGTEDPDE